VRQTYLAQRAFAQLSLPEKRSLSYLKIRPELKLG
jgi:hypothetical protein